MKPSLRPLIDIERLRDAYRHGTGQAVRVAVLDTGVEGSHPALTGKIRAQYEVAADRSGQHCIKGNMSDPIGHGTACAGIILQLAPQAEITSIRVIGEQARGTGDQLVCGLAFALNEGFDIINMSLGTTDARIVSRLGALADKAFYQGQIIVAAANNQGQPAFPAHLSSVLSVSMEGFENPEMIRYAWGNVIEVAARGVYVEAPARGGGTQLYTGTSFACPHVSGLLARVRSVYPGLSAFEARFLLSLLAEPAQ